MKRNVLIMGATGSIGKSTLEVIRRHPDLFNVAGLAVHSNVRDLLPMIKEFKPRAIAVYDDAKRSEFSADEANELQIDFGAEAIRQIASDLDYDIFVGAMVGKAGLEPTIEAIKRGKRIALANKETLVVAGELITKLCYEHNAELLPIDSEHSAIFQCLIGERLADVRKLIITASGGPFLSFSNDELSKVTIEQALHHPTWKMGAKITIDSATMMNKGLEVIEAHWLFNLPKEKIDVVIHPQSIIHSMIEFVDGSIKAQLSTPDMKIPIQYALSYPDRLPAEYVQTKLPAIKNLTFEEPDPDRFECLKLAYEALEAGGTAPCVLNAANEIAVAKFLAGKVNFTKIPYIIRLTLDKINNISSPDLDSLIEFDRSARIIADEIQ